MDRGICVDAGGGAPAWSGSRGCRMPMRCASIYALRGGRARSRRLPARPSSGLTLVVCRHTRPRLPPDAGPVPAWVHAARATRTAPPDPGARTADGQTDCRRLWHMRNRAQPNYRTVDPGPRIRDRHPGAPRRTRAPRPSERRVTRTRAHTVTCTEFDTQAHRQAQARRYRSRLMITHSSGVYKYAVDVHR